LKIEAHRSPALKAIIIICFTDDGYTDDCHNIGGCVSGSEMLSWASIMFAYNSFPPGPDVARECWREIRFLNTVAISLDFHCCFC
jgi:predicted acyl esterase